MKNEGLSLNLHTAKLQAKILNSEKRNVKSEQTRAKDKDEEKKEKRRKKNRIKAANNVLPHPL